MQKSVLAILLFFIAGFLAGVAARSLILPESSPPPDGETQVRNALPGNHSGKSRNQSDALAQAPANSGLTDELKFYNEISKASSGAYPVLARSILNLPDSSPHRAAALDILMRKWAAEDPAGSLSFARSLAGSDRDEAFRSSLLFLGAENFPWALEWMKNNMTPTNRQVAEIWLYTGLSRQDPGSAMAAIESLPDGKLKKDALLTTVADWAQRDVLSAFQWYENAPWNGAMFSIYKSLMDQYMKQYPREARSLVENMDDGYWKNRYREDLVRQFTAENPQLALEIATELPTGALQSSAIDSVFQEWSEADPYSAMESAYAFVNGGQYDDSLVNDVFRNAAFGLHWEDPAALRNEYQNLPRNIRHEIVGPMVAQWIQEDPLAAGAWVDRLPGDSIEYNLAKSSIANHYKDWDPIRALEVSGDIEYQEIRFDAVQSALQSLYLQNPTQAIKLAQDSPLVPEEAYDMFLRWAEDLGEEYLVILIPDHSD